ncbi:hypothetical protein ABZ357_05350 [Streptomyces sp. NPDC005917]|uniref:hypothetical protein n=1 Tax=unclassified Streptomyces TaxID=2593676 RepID=UPI0033C849AD
MSADKKRRPPAPVIAAVVLWALPAVAMLLVGVVGAIAKGNPVVLSFALLGFLPGMTALGLWQGNRGARVVAIVFGLAYGVGVIAMILLLSVPRSSRDWFTPDFLKEPSEDYLEESSEG